MVKENWNVFFSKGYLLSFDMAHAPDYFDEEHGM